MKQYGLIGFPLSHSFSKRFFTEKFEQENIRATYRNFEIKSISELPSVIGKNPELIGLNVTIPYKEQVIPCLNELDKAAAQIGAVNTIKITRENSGFFLKGFNTDTYGFEQAIEPLLKSYHQKALILGTGGASKAIKFVLEKLGIGYISATTGKPQKNRIKYENIDKKMMAERLLIINATPLGTYPQTDSSPAIPYEFITKKHLLFDLVYNPEVTLFLKKGKARGAAIKNGYEMLEQQALKSYEIWNENE